MHVIRLLHRSGISIQISLLIAGSSVCMLVHVGPELAPRWLIFSSVAKTRNSILKGSVPKVWIDQGVRQPTTSVERQTTKDEKRTTDDERRTTTDERRRARPQGFPRRPQGFPKASTNALLPKPTLPKVSTKALPVSVLLIASPRLPKASPQPPKPKAFPRRPRRLCLQGLSLGRRPRRLCL